MIKLFLLLSLALVALSIPYEDQITLTNSLIVGRDDYSDLYNWECKVCAAENKPIHTHPIEEKAKDVKCIISVYKNFMVLAFRYTNTALNVWQDILYPLQVQDEHTCPNCKVQKAYSNMWEVIKNDVISDLKEMKKATGLETLYITGISMGGGLSVISYIDINHESLFQNVKITTYGAPRVGNKHWAAHFDLITGKRAKRYYIKGDEIVVLPRCLTLLCTYRQTGVGIICHPDKQICVQEEYIPEERPFEYLREIQKSRKFFGEEQFGNLIQHANGYPKLYNYTLKL